MNIYEKIAKVRVELQNTNLNKSGKNNYAGYDYFQLKDFIPTLNKLMEETKIFSNFSIKDDVATLTLINSEKPEEIVIFTSPVADANLKGCTPVQSLGGVHTYLKRYLYQNAFEIVEDDALDHETGNPNKKVEYATAEQLAILNTYNIPSEWLKTKFGVSYINDLTKDQAQFILNAKKQK